jgi:hypothetical protein
MMLLLFGLVTVRITLDLPFLEITENSLHYLKKASYLAQTPEK